MSNPTFVLEAFVVFSMIPIPAGRFQMGSPPEEEGRDADEGPQHEVTLEAFWLGQTPITQAQWRVVASWPKVERELARDPSRFKGDDRPVEQVSWHDAMEFCRRLSQRLGRTFTLPSEAQWEYACRAGTTTPFALGETISPELANYDGSVAFANGPTGLNRGETTPVGSFPANAWGFHDMHGNVFEWCLDHWHDSYTGAPADGSAWLSNAGEYSLRLLRGGSWSNFPRYCRSAYRNNDRPVIRSNGIGFRVCCLPEVNYVSRQSDLSLLKQTCIKYINKNTPLQIRLGLLLLGFCALFNPGGVVMGLCIQCAKKRDELPEDFKELLLHLT